MRNLIAFPLLLLAVILQSSVVSQVQLLAGYADLPLLILAAWALQKKVDTAWHWAALACVLVAFFSGMPWLAPTAGYMAVVLFSGVFQRRVWQAPLLAMFSVVFAGVFFIHLLSFVSLQISGVPLSFLDVMGLITLPSLLLNMLFSIPVYAFMRDLARWVYPAEEYE
jgi:cytochrome b subunit of formate dehydrogenase